MCVCVCIVSFKCVCASVSVLCLSSLHNVVAIKLPHTTQHMHVHTTKAFHQLCCHMSVVFKPYPPPESDRLSERKSGGNW